MKPIRVINQTLLVPESGSPCEAWKTYFDQLKSMVGTDYARQLWLYTWDFEGASACTSDPHFSKWLLKHDLDVTNVATRALADFSEVGSNVLGLGKTLTGMTRYAVPALLILTLLLVVYLVPKLSKSESLSQMAMLTPYGRGAAMAKTLVQR